VKTGGRTRHLPSCGSGTRCELRCRRLHVWCTASYRSIATQNLILGVRDHGARSGVMSLPGYYGPHGSSRASVLASVSRRRHRISGSGETPRLQHRLASSTPGQQQRLLVDTEVESSSKWCLEAPSSRPGRGGRPTWIAPCDGAVAQPTAAFVVSLPPVFLHRGEAS
jgi:hypothetical protein